MAPRTAIVATLLLSLPLGSCTIVGAGIGTAADEGRERRPVSAEAFDRLDDGEEVTARTLDQRVVSGYVRKPPHTTGHARVFVRADGREVLTKSKLSGVEGKPPPEGVWIGGGIGLAIDVVLIAAALSVQVKPFRGPGPDLNH